MRYLVSVLDGDPVSGPHTSGSATAEEMAEISAFNDRLQVDGYLLFAAGLSAPEAAVVVDNRDHAVRIVDSPAVSSGVFVAGIWIWDVPTHESALQLAAAASQACNRRLEVRAAL